MVPKNTEDKKRRNVFQFKTKIWYLQGSSVVPITNHYASYSVTRGFHEFSPGEGFHHGLTFFEKEGDIGTWAMDEAEFIAGGQRIASSLSKVNEFLRRWTALN